MSATPTREVAKRAFAREFNDATYTFKESDDDRAPLYALLPTGERMNRLFFTGTVTEVTNVGEEADYFQARVIDTAGDPFFVYSGQYQDQPTQFLRHVETPAFVAVVGKPRTYETEDGNTNVSVRPESIVKVDEDTTTKWTIETADRTIERIGNFDENTLEYCALAAEEYDADLDQYRQNAISALEGLDDD